MLQYLSKNFSGQRFQLNRLFHGMWSRYKVLMERRNMQYSGGTKEIDFGRLASCSRRGFEATKIPEFGVLKAYCLFYQDGPNIAVETIHALEQVIHSLNRNHYLTAPVKLHLALGHLSVYIKSRDPGRRHLTGTAMPHLSLSVVSVANDKGTIGYNRTEGIQVPDITPGLMKAAKDLVYIGDLLRKGFCVSQDKQGKSWVLHLLRKLFGLGSEAKRLEATFAKLFVEEVPQNEEQGGQHSIGIGKHPGYALQLLEAMLAKGLQKKLMHTLIGVIHHLGGICVPINTSEADQNYSKAIDLGSSIARSNMAVLRNGNQAEGNDVSSLETAITDEDSTAMNNLAVAYDLGKGDERNAERAEELYEQMIDKDQHPIALFNLAPHLEETHFEIPGCWKLENTIVYPLDY